MVLVQVVIGGGQEASQVTMTSTRVGKFEAKFFHKVGVLLRKLLRELGYLLF